MVSLYLFFSLLGLSLLVARAGLSGCPMAPKPLPPLAPPPFVEIREIKTQRGKHNESRIDMISLIRKVELRSIADDHHRPSTC